jgi:hypothetical protein
LSRAALIRSALALLILLAVALAASTWRIYGHTWDEPEHLAAGLELLDRGHYEYDTEHPPLARLLIALGPWLAGSHSFGTPPPSGVAEGVDILYDGGHYQRTLTLARLGALPFLGLLLWATWLWGRRVAGCAHDVEALLGVLLLASVPAVIGHAALAALDVPGTATTLLALYLMQRWMFDGTMRTAALCGFTAGVAICTKFSAIPFLAVGALVMLMVRLGPGIAPRVAARGGTLASTLLVLVTMAIPVLLAYGPRAIAPGPLPARLEWIFPYLFQDTGLRAQAHDLIAPVRLPVALWELAEGIMALKAHNDTGHLSYLFGQLKAGGWWYFYLVDLAVKTPLPLLLTGIPGLALLAHRGWKSGNPWQLTPAALFLALLAFASLFSRINIGVRHVLILYPFLALGAAHALRRLWGQRAVFFRLLAGSLLLWQLGDCGRAWPDYFPWFNELARDPQTMLTDSDLDWGGQDLKRLEARLAALGIRQFSLAYEGTADLRREPLPETTVLRPGIPVSGWVAVTALARAHAKQGYAWLNRYQPVERIGAAIDLYHIPTEQAPAPPSGQD